MSNEYNVVIGVYAGVNLISKIIEAVDKQTIKPKSITLWAHKHPDKPFVTYDYTNSADVIFCTNNYGVYPRFAVGLFGTTDRVMIFDDDTIPGPKWAENCFNTLDIVGHDAILGARGVTIDKDGREIGSFGNDRNTTEITEVDLVGHCWFVNRKHIIEMFKDPPFNPMNGEDICLSANSQITYGCKTYVPAQPNNNPDIKGSIRPILGAQPGRLSTTLGPATHLGDRAEVAKHYIGKGWKLVND